MLPSSDSQGVRTVRNRASRSDERFDLAILIPTYNRQRQLSLLLAQLREELQSVTSRVQIIISNNASRDETERVALEFLNSVDGTAVDYHRQSTNVGAIRNVHFLVRQARATHAWCIADDDLLVPGALAAVARVLVVTSPPMLLVRAEGVSEWDAIPVDNRLPIGSSLRAFNPASAEGAQYLMAAGFLSSLILRSKLWGRIIERVDKYADADYSNWAAALLAAQSLPDPLVLTAPCVRGNANAVGVSPIPSFGVLVLGRALIWRELTRDGTRSALWPHIFVLFRFGWWGIFDGHANDVHGRPDILRFFWTGLRILGWPALSATPFAIGALTLPLALRRRLRKWRMESRGVHG